MTIPNRTSAAATITATVVAIILGAGIIALAVINPYALIGLGPVLLAVAAIVRAFIGTSHDTDT